MKWTGLTEEEVGAVLASMPHGLDGYLVHWGWSTYARAVEERLRLKNARKPVAVIFDEDGAQVVVPFAETEYSEVGE